MFGESDSESPRVPSPWDCIISAPPSPATQPQNSVCDNIPRLVPEAEDGNIEYKLQLLDPSPARFARLVTQLKWRLLEGGGQAYYELGVADNGALVGLPRAELDLSLETLEMMAGEIGASVIVVRKVEVPVAIAGSAASETDYWNGRRRHRKSFHQSGVIEVNSTAEADSDDGDAVPDMSLDLSPTILTSATHPASVSETTHSPPVFPTALEITSVFEPLGMRSRHHCVFPVDLAAPAYPSSDTESRDELIASNNHSPHPTRNESTGSVVVQTKQEAKMMHRSQARDRKRAAKQKDSPNPIVAVLNDSSPLSESIANVAQPSSLDASVDVPHNPGQTADSDSIPVLQLDGSPIVNSEGATSPDLSQPPTSTEPRLIIEALVVRKMSSEEAFLDFSGFSLT